MKYLNLIRYKNLIFIVLLLCLMRYCVIDAWLEFFGIAPQTPDWIFALYSLAAVLISAGGYVINDYFDTKIDALNRPDKQIVGNTVSREAAARLHHVLTGIGVVLGLVAAFHTRSLTIGVIFIMVPGLLWFYSASYKRQFLVGNVIIAFCSALLVLLTVITESACLTKTFSVELLNQTPVLPTLYKWVCGFALFAFLATLIREIIKDMQDEYGDREQECRTMPVVWGFKKTKFFVSGLIVLTLAIMAFLVTYGIHFQIDKLTRQYFLFGGLLPFICLLYLIIRARRSADYRQASTLAKFIMLVGSLYSLVLYFLLAQNFGISLFGLFQLTL